MKAVNKKKVENKISKIENKPELPDRKKVHG
jgi:hypothetical protein